MKQFFLKTWRHALAIILCAGAVCFLAFVETSAYYRAFTSCVYFWRKLVYYVVFFFGEGAKPGYLLPEMVGYPDAFPGMSGVDFAAFWGDVTLFVPMLFTRGYSLNWVVSASDALMGLTRALMNLSLLACFAMIAFNSYFAESQALWSRKSPELKAWEWVKDHPLYRFVTWVCDYAKWFYKSGYFYFVLTVLAFALRLPSYALDLVGEYLYFFASFDVVSLLDVAFAILISLFRSLNFVPLGGKVVIGYALFRWLSYRKARKLVEGKLMPHDEAVVNADTGVFTLILGVMRGGKTTLATAFARIANTVYHKNAYDNMNRVSLMFPSFPYQPFERDIVRLASKRRVVNMQQAAAFAYRLYEKSLQKPSILYGYDVNRERSAFYDGAVNIGLADALAIYAESYWIYFHGSNLIASNYPIRTDDLKVDKGHLVLWDYSTFRRKNKEMGKFSMLSHILVWDMLRFGKKVDPDSKWKDVAGPMVCVATEFGKEYGNMVTNSTYSATDEEANPKNDLLDYSMKLGGHLANIWHTNFFKFIADEQRSGSLSSNLVDVAQTIFTADPKNQTEKIALHLWWVEPLILDWIIRIRDKFYIKYRLNREDGTLMFRFLNAVASLAYQREAYVYNRFGYKECLLPNCTADSSGNLIEGDTEKFYIINYIDFAYRFESACMKDFLNAKKSDAIRGFFDLPTYLNIMPTKAEWDIQGSYVVSDLEDPAHRFSNKQAGRVKNGSRRPVGANRSGRASAGGK
jgi:hypothetical protein